MLHILFWLNVKFNIQLYFKILIHVSDSEDKLAINLLQRRSIVLISHYTCMLNLTCTQNLKETTISLQSGRHYVLDRSPLDVANNRGLYDRRKL